MSCRTACKTAKANKTFHFASEISILHSHRTAISVPQNVDCAKFYKINLSPFRLRNFIFMCMTSTNQTSSGAVANLVSSSPELLTRPASKPDDRPVSSTGELCTSVATALPSPGGEGQGEGVLPQPLFTPDFPTRNEFLKLNLAAILVRVQDMGNGGGSGHG